MYIRHTSHATQTNVLFLSPEESNSRASQHLLNLSLLGEPVGQHSQSQRQPDIKLLPISALARIQYFHHIRMIKKKEARSQWKIMNVLI